MQQNGCLDISQTNLLDSKERLDEFPARPYVVIVRCTNIARPAHEANRSTPMRFATALEPDPSFLTLCIKTAQSTFSDVMPSFDDPGAPATAPKTRAASADRGRSWTSAISDWFYRQQVAKREAYLADATDIFDLERRMRQYDLRPYY
jgi:hypothetical protein